MRAMFFGLCLILSLSGHASDAAYDPLGLLLTWQRDPSTTMTIDWYTPPGEEDTQLSFRPAGEQAEWAIATGLRLDFPHSERLVHRVELTGLDADTEYEFLVGRYTRVRAFRTMPDDVVQRPVRFISGGDVRHEIAWAEQTARQVMHYEPDFVLWGGDLAYANGNPELVDRWYELLNASMHALVTPSGRQVPVLASLGNHEVKGGYYYNNDHALREGVAPYTDSDASREAIAPFFYRLFAFPGQPGYGVMDFGDYLSIVFLDTDHANPIDGAQSQWLQDVLDKRADTPHVFPIYHVGGFPAVRNPDAPTHRRVREHWLPLFERSTVKVAFENHDHVYKRTFPIRDGRVDSRGIVYFGDGAWGTVTRELGRDHTDTAWYIERAAAQRHAIVVTLQGSHQHFTVVNENGRVIDEYPRSSLTDDDESVAPRWSGR